MEKETKESQFKVNYLRMRNSLAPVKVFFTFFFLSVKGGKNEINIHYLCYIWPQIAGAPTTAEKFT